MAANTISRRTVVHGALALALAPAVSRRTSAAEEPLVLRSAQDLPRLVPGVPMAGNPQGDVTVAEFFDYRCSYCRKMQPSIARLLAEDPKVQLVLMEWPIFGGISIEVAAAAIAASWQGRYRQVHDGLFAYRGPLDHDALREIVQAAGVDVPRLDDDLVRRHKDIVAILRQVNGVAEALGFNSTPSLLIGDNPIPGTLPYEDLKGLVDGVRALSARQ